MNFKKCVKLAQLCVCQAQLRAPIWCIFRCSETTLYVISWRKSCCVVCPHWDHFLVLVALCDTTFFPLSYNTLTFHITLLLRTWIFFQNHITSWPILGVCAHCNSFGRFCERLLCTVPTYGTYHDFLFLSCDIYMTSLFL